MDNKTTKDRLTTHLEYDWFKYILVAAALIVAVCFSFSSINSVRGDEDVQIFFSCYSQKSALDEDDLARYTLSRRVTEKAADPDYDKEKYGDNIILSTNVYYASVTMNEYAQLFQTQGQISSDALILKKNFILTPKETDADGNTLPDAPDNYQSALGYLKLDEKIDGEQFSPLELIGVDDETKFEYLRLDDKGDRVSTGGHVYGVRVDFANGKGLKNLDKVAYLKNETAGESEEETDHMDEFYFFINRGASENLGAYSGKKKADKENKQAFFVFKTFFEIYKA